MNYLGIDFGEKYIGIAISYNNQKIAFPYKTLENKDENLVFKNIKDICDLKNIKKIIVGLPLNKQMKITQEAIVIKKFTKRLKKFLKLPIEFENELFSTKIIEKSFGKSKRINEAAAAVILQSWIDKQLLIQD